MVIIHHKKQVSPPQLVKDNLIPCQQQLLGFLWRGLRIVENNNVAELALERGNWQETD